MIIGDKVIQFFCIIEEFNKNFNAEFNKNLLLPNSVLNNFQKSERSCFH